MNEKKMVREQSIDERERVEERKVKNKDHRGKKERHAKGKGAVKGARKGVEVKTRHEEKKIPQNSTKV